MRSSVFNEAQSSLHSSHVTQCCGVLCELMVKVSHLKFRLCFSFHMSGILSFFFNFSLNEWVKLALALPSLLERGAEPFHARVWGGTNCTVGASCSHVIWGELIRGDLYCKWVKRFPGQKQKASAASLIDFWQLFLTMRQLGTQHINEEEYLKDDLHLYRLRATNILYFLYFAAGSFFRVQTLPLFLPTVSRCYLSLNLHHNFSLTTETN